MKDQIAREDIVKLWDSLGRQQEHMIKYYVHESDLKIQLKFQLDMIREEIKSLAEALGCEYKTGWIKKDKE